MEVVVLKRLQNTTPHVCTFLGCGRTEEINYIAMSLLGPSLSELRKQQPKQKFSLSTTLRVGVQVISAVRAMHDCGFLHRDIKPSNFAIGSSSATKRTCFMLDFGLARQYMTPTGEIRPPRPVAGFRGTVRYASINAHQSKDLGRHDDLWSVFYMLVELATGELPWKKIRDKETAGKSKIKCNHKQLVKSLPSEFCDFYDHLMSLNYYQKPDYHLLKTLLQNALRYLGVNQTDLFDWEQDLSMPSVTTASVGSAPAFRSNNESQKGEGGEEAEKRVDGRGELRTNCSEVGVCLSKNEEEREKVAQRNSGVSSAPLRPKASPQLAEGAVSSSASNGDKRGRGKDMAGRHARPASNSSSGENVVRPPSQMKKLPSPLLRATHLLQNGSGSIQQDSLDRFFDAKVGGSRDLVSSSEPSKKASKDGEMLEREESDVGRGREEVDGGRGPSNSQEGSGGPSPGAQSRPSGSKSLSNAGEGPSPGSEDMAGVHLEIRSSGEDKEGEEEGEQHSVNSPPPASSESSCKSEERKQSLEPRDDHCPEVHPDTPIPPQLGYQVTSSPLEPVVSQWTALGEVYTVGGQRSKGPKGLPDISGLCVVIETSSGQDSQANEGTGVEGKRKEGGGDGRKEEVGGERKREERVERGFMKMRDGGREERESGVLSPDAATDEAQRHWRPPAETGARSLQVLDFVDSGQQIETPAESSDGGKYSPGPPPLDFNSERLQKTWGRDSTRPLSLSCRPLLFESETEDPTPHVASSLLIPRPPPHSPPHNYTLISARRRRFRRPSKV